MLRGGVSPGVCRISVWGATTPGLTGLPPRVRRSTDTRAHALHRYRPEGVQSADVPDVRPRISPTLLEDRQHTARFKPIRHRPPQEFRRPNQCAKSATLQLSDRPYDNTGATGKPNTFLSLINLPPGCHQFCRASHHQPPKPTGRPRPGPTDASPRVARKALVSGLAAGVLGVDCSNIAVSPWNRHDCYFRHVMSRAADAATELRPLVAKEVAARLQWDELELVPGSFVSHELQSRCTDILYRTRYDDREAYLYLLLEHQSSSDPLMAVRLAEYEIAFWRRWLKDNPKSNTVPMVFPVVLFCDPSGGHWTAPLDLSEVIDLDAASRTSLADYLPRWRYVVDDLSTVDVDALLARELTPAVATLFFLLKVAPRKPRLGLEDLRPIMRYLGTLARAGSGELEAALTYILSMGDTDRTDLEPVVDQLGPEAKEALMTTAERFVAKGRAEALLELLALRFGPVPTPIAERVHSSSIDQLQQWTARVLTAETLAKIFEQ
ncbi:Rpn family recombination-promoting nuclease/putative transposase [Nocardia sp. CDC160]|uniref:Rpn family recombination-promoting nuclease/putative transposase n=1 Tax=Nocardia sp. CDC160 TaxID=3112166 RepID=UPI002DBD0484|nr:Rpn family recombination-promoting nuclease/putative transposase [Nocardia sp. CDC160]MEC3917461.1 Rpn family recombination-promoting nuclease/putative transposase [Nocardia sp. CDC160]